MKNSIRQKFAMGAFAALMAFGAAGCAKASHLFNEFKGSIVGNTYTIDTFDNFGKKTMTTNGKKINVEGNYINESEDGTADLTSVLTILVDGDTIISSGDTLVFYEKGLEPDYDWSVESIDSTSNPLNPMDNTLVAGKVNAIKNVFGKDEVVVIKSQTGAPIYAFSGDSVYWEIPEDLPKFTKLTIDGKSLYIHRANFQIIDKDLLE